MKRNKIRSQMVQFVIREDIFDKLDLEKDDRKINSVDLLVKQYLIELDLSGMTIDDVIKVRLEKARLEREEGAV